MEKTKKIDFLEILEQLTEEFKEASLRAKEAKGINYENLSFFKAVLAIQVVLIQVIELLDVVHSNQIKIQREIGRLEKFNDYLIQKIEERITEVKEYLLQEMIKKRQQ